MENSYMGADANVSDALYKQIIRDSKTAAEELICRSNISKGDILVIGCSSSEILGSVIGKGSSYKAAEAVFSGIYPLISEKGIYLAAQCCEHLNRAIVIERECAEKYGYDEVSAVPQPKAGGSFATVVYKNLTSPVLVEHIKAHAGIDIGGTLIGMHLRDVAVPLRLSVTKIGEANLICAMTRPKYIGGERTKYC